MEQREKDRLLWNLKSMPNEVDDLLIGLDEEMLSWHPVPGKWSIKEVLCHLRDSEQYAFQVRISRILTEQDPYLPEVDQNQLAVTGDYINQDAAAALSQLKSLRDETAQTLDAAPLEAWDRIGDHWSAGRASLAQLVARQTEHDFKHLIQMKDIVRLKMPW
jgi:hypothetical protein